MSVLLTLLATIVLTLAALGVALFGRSPVELIALGLALYTAAHLAWDNRRTP